MLAGARPRTSTSAATAATSSLPRRGSRSTAPCGRTTSSRSRRMPPKPVDAVELRQFLEPPRPAPAPPPAGMPANGCRPEALARTVALTPEGGRNRALFWASCRMAENGLEPRRRHELARCRPRSTPGSRTARSRRRSTPRSASPPGSAPGAARALPQRVKGSTCEHARRVPPPQLPAAGAAGRPAGRRRRQPASSHTIATRHSQSDQPAPAQTQKRDRLGPPHRARVVRSRPMVGRGIDLQAELVRRARRTPTTTTRALQPPRHPTDRRRPPATARKDWDCERLIRDPRRAPRTPHAPPRPDSVGYWAWRHDPEAERAHAVHDPQVPIAGEQAPLRAGGLGATPPSRPCAPAPSGAPTTRGPSSPWPSRSASSPRSAPTGCCARRPRPGGRRSPGTTTHAGSARPRPASRTPR